MKKMLITTAMFLSLDVTMPAPAKADMLSAAAGLVVYDQKCARLPSDLAKNVTEMMQALPQDEAAEAVNKAIASYTTMGPAKYCSVVKKMIDAS